MVVETAIVVPVLLVFIGLIAVVGMMSSAAGTVEQAAREAARTASLERTSTAASASAERTAQTSLTEQDLTCADFAVTSNVAALSTPAGTAGQVSVEVRCTVDFSHLPVPGLSTRTYTAQAASAVDTYRERG
ncbi:TadE/TadG family type IV pilus assembly protein [Pseudactinotalea sp. Z1748]|uniref:TadE/TadG family type IV pilus assembly protein n=1 Tax=Pseudactinotalea sp. Z1748 TaxID=3413027 RepID=UPI003C7EDA0A